jgi:hypothetical protein
MFGFRPALTELIDLCSKNWLSYLVEISSYSTFGRGAWKKFLANRGDDAGLHPEPLDCA